MRLISARLLCAAFMVVGCAKGSPEPSQPTVPQNTNPATWPPPAVDAEKHLEAAVAKEEAFDGQGCLAELDAHDRIDPRPEGLSTNPKSKDVARLRAYCLMRVGRCDEGAALLKQVPHPLEGLGPDAVNAS